MQRESSEKTFSNLYEAEASISENSHIPNWKSANFGLQNFASIYSTGNKKSPSNMDVLILKHNT